MASGNGGTVRNHMRYRVLVPWIAGRIRAVADGNVGSWNSSMFGLLLADSLFVAGTGLLIVLLGGMQLGGDVVGLVAALLYFVNFANANLRLTGLVDAGEGFFLLMLLWSVETHRFWMLLPTAVLGALTKESFVPFSIVFLVAWVLMRREWARRGTTIWIFSSGALSVATLIELHLALKASGNLIDFGRSLHQNQHYFGHLISSLLDRNLWYIFAWLLPMGVPYLRNFPKSWVVPTGATAVTAFILDGYYGGAPGTLGRALFSTSGPLLRLSMSYFICGNECQSSRNFPERDVVL